MKRIALALCILFAGTAALCAQESDPTDVSALLSELGEIGLPTIESVESIGNDAHAYFEAGNWEDGADAYAMLAKNANWLANLIRSGLEPYYSASYDERDDFPYSKLRPLVPIETLSNAYVRIRNEAMVKEGLCYGHLSDNLKAVSVLYKALDLIDIENEALWAEAREALFEIIGVEL